MEISEVDFESMVASTMKRISAHLRSLPTTKVNGNLSRHDEFLCGLRQRSKCVPETGADFEKQLDFVFDECLPRSLATNAPGYLGYIPGGGVLTVAIADLIQDTTNRFTGIYATAPALLELESNAIHWLCRWMHLPEATCSGVFTSGGSMANLNAIVCAREHCLGQSDLVRRGCIYVSSQVHHCVQKAARIAGIFADRVRTIDVDERFRMRIDALEAAIAADRSAGLQPFLAVGSAGTVGVGAVDDLNRIADVCARERMWFHVDGAYGAFFHLIDQLRPTLAGLERADSIAVDPHKGLGLPYGTGALLVRDVARLRAAFAPAEGTAHVLPTVDSEVHDPSLLGPELSRGNPGLRVWLTIAHFGARVIRASIGEKRELSVRAFEALSAVECLRIVAPPALSLFAYHIVLGSIDEENQATLESVDRVNADGRAMISATKIDGRVLARLCVLSLRTHTTHIDVAIAVITDAARSIVAAKHAHTNTQ